MTDNLSAIVKSKLSLMILGMSSKLKHIAFITILLLMEWDRSQLLEECLWSNPLGDMQDL